MKQSMETLSQWLTNLLLASALLLAVAAWLPGALHMKACVVESSSMEPAIKVGSVVYVRPYEAEEQICPGDIVSFQAGAVMVTHRVVSVNPKEDTIITKGDANGVCDRAPVPREAIYGKVRFQIPWIGYLLLR